MSSCERVVKGKHSRDLAARAGWSSSLILGGALLALGCAATAQTTAPPHSAAKLSGSAPPPLSLARTVVTPESTTDIPELFAQATAEGKAQRYSVAGAAFERAFELDPNGPL